MRGAASMPLRFTRCPTEAFKRADSYLWGGGEQPPYRCGLRGTSRSLSSNCCSLACFSETLCHHASRFLCRFSPLLFTPG